MLRFKSRSMSRFTSRFKSRFKSRFRSRFMSCLRSRFRSRFMSRFKSRFKSRFRSRFASRFVVMASARPQRRAYGILAEKMPPIYGKIEPKFQNRNYIFFRFKRDGTIFFAKKLFPSSVIKVMQKN